MSVAFKIIRLDVILKNSYLLFRNLGKYAKNTNKSSKSKVIYFQKKLK